eukprot:scaffold27695_cov64-Phaeocystis_antarctica.AAC.1
MLARWKKWEIQKSSESRQASGSSPTAKTVSGSNKATEARTETVPVPSTSSTGAFGPVGTRHSFPQSPYRAGRRLWHSSDEPHERDSLSLVPCMHLNVLWPAAPRPGVSHMHTVSSSAGAMPFSVSAAVERDKPWRKSGHSSGACLGGEVQRDELAAVIDVVVAPDDHRRWISLATLAQCSQELGGGAVVLGHPQAVQHAGPPAGAVVLPQPLRIRDVWRRGQLMRAAVVVKVQTTRKGFGSGSGDCIGAAAGAVETTGRGARPCGSGAR